MRFACRSARRSTLRGQPFHGFRETEQQDGKLLSDKQVTVGSLTGIELKTLGKDADTLARMFDTQGRSYRVSGADGCVTSTMTFPAARPVRLRSHAAPSCSKGKRLSMTTSS